MNRADDTTNGDNVMDTNNVLALSEAYRAAIASVCEGWTLPDGARKVLESALWSQPVAAAPLPVQAQPVVIYVNGDELANAHAEPCGGVLMFATERSNWFKTPLYDHAQPVAAPAIQAQPVAKPDLTVWYGQMPESNGKSNFTAVLMRKGAELLEGITSGITIERSEYPDRVRYEADRMRFLIGERAEEPWILDYDADKHSGYAVTQPVAAAPDLSVARDARAEKAHTLFLDGMKCIGLGDGTKGWIEHADEDGPLRRDSFSLEGEIIFGFEHIKAHIEELKAALQPVAAAPDLSEITFNATRLRNVIRLVGLSDPFSDDDESLLGAMGAILGQVAGALRSRPAAAPVAAGESIRHSNEFNELLREIADDAVMVKNGWADNLVACVDAWADARPAAALVAAPTEQAQ